MENRENAARQLAGDIEAMIARAHSHGLETLVYVLETAKIEALRATKPAQSRKPG